MIIQAASTLAYARREATPPIFPKTILVNVTILIERVENSKFFPWQDLS